MLYVHLKIIHIMVVFHFHHNQHSIIEDEINKEITKISHWLHSNKLLLNTAKSKFMVFILSDPGYFRQLTIRGGALKAPPPYDLKNYCVNLHHIIHVNFTRCFWHDPTGIFQKFAILTILQRFQNKK